MSTPPPLLDPFQQQPPPMVMTQQAYTAHSGHGTVGPFIGVLAVIAILGAIAVVIGRLCSGRGIMGHGHYDFESWIETKCSSCIDGRVETPMPRRPVDSSGSGEAPPLAAAAAAAEEADPETKEEEEEEAASSDQPGHQQHHPHERVES